MSHLEILHYHFKQISVLSESFISKLNFLKLFTVIFNLLDFKVLLYELYITLSWNSGFLQSHSCLPAQG